MKNPMDMLRTWRWRRRQRSMFSDEKSWNEYQCLLNGPVPGKPIALAMQELGGTRVWVRPDRPDVKGLHNVFGAKYHLPPVEPRQNGVILDLGANLGYTALHFLRKYPGCRVVAVEMDQDNFQMASRNLENDTARCSLINAAVWTEDGSIEYDGNDPEALSIESVRSQRGEGTETAVVKRTSPAKTVETILRDNGLGDATIDYVKMDIEGAEHFVLAQRNGWLDRVQSMKVEFHRPATDQSVVDLLTSKGFRAWRDPKHWASVTAIRETNS